MGNIAYEKAFRKQLKKTYKGLTDEQKQYVKAKERFEQSDKDLNRFYRTAKRNINGAVDFENMSELDLNLFTQLNQIKESAMKVMEKISEQIDVDYTLNVYMEINTHSMSF